MRRRKINFLAVRALLNRKKLSRSNTKVVVLADGTSEMYLFNNKIAIYKPNGDVYLSFAGWPTRTTKSRLGAFPLAIIISGTNLASINGVVMIATTDWVLYANIKACGDDYIVEHILKLVCR
jgi:hypothetical protein